MHILIAVFTVITGLATWYLRLKAIGTAARDVGKFAQKARNAPRKMAFMHKASKTGLKGVTDPREAGTILMVLVASARAGQALSPDYSDLIEAEVGKVFYIDSEQAKDLVTHAVWMVRDVELVSGVVLRMTDVIKRTPGMGPPELTDLYEMLVAVSEMTGEPDEDQLHILGLYRNKVGLSV